MGLHRLDWVVIYTPKSINLKFNTMKKLIITTVIFLFSGCLLFAQNHGTIKGRVMANDLKESLPSASVYVKVGGNLIGASSNLDGYFTIKPLDPGSYDVHVSYNGYKEITVKNVKVDVNSIAFIKDVYLNPISSDLTGVEIIWERPIINKDGANYDIIDAKQIEELPVKNDIPQILTTISPKVLVSDDGKKLYFRGSRDGDAVYFIDGVKLRNSDIKVPGGAIKSIAVYSGGVPAKYGDFTGGAVVIETKGYFDWLAEARWRDQMMKKRDAERIAFKKEEEKKFNEKKTKKTKNKTCPSG